MTRRYSGRPLDQLWDDSGEFGECVRDEITEAEIVTLLQKRPARFVELNVGDPPLWIPSKQRFEFWDSIRQNLYVPTKPHIEDYPDCFFYSASEWAGRDGERVVVLYKYH